MKTQKRKNKIKRPAAVPWTPENKDLALIHQRIFDAIEARIMEHPDHVTGDALPLRHDFADGICSRTMSAPKGTLVLGKRHRFRIFNILLSGEATIYFSVAEPPKRFKAPATFVSDAMTRRLFFFHEDSEIINILPTSETDPERIEKHCIIPEPEFIKLIQHGRNA